MVKEQKIKQKSGLSNEQLKDGLIAFGISGGVCLLAYFYFIEPFMMGLFNWSKTATIILTIVLWLAASGMLMEKIAKRKAHEKMAYEKSI